MKRLIYMALAVYSASAMQYALASGQVGFYSTVDRVELEIGQTLTLTVIVTVDDADKIRGLNLPQPSGFEVVSTSQAVQTSFTFGAGGRRSERSTTHTLILRAVTSGPQIIPPAIMEYDGNVHRTKPISINVLPIGDMRRKEQKQPSRQRGFPGLFDDDFDPMGIFDQLQRQLEGDAFGRRPEPAPGKATPVSDGDIFVRVGVDKTDVWLGEQITADIVIYSRYDIAGFPSPPTMPQMEGFWQEDLERPSQIRPQLRQIRGTSYRTYLLRRLAIFPTRAGTLIIDPVEVEVETGLGMFRGRRNFKRRSKPVSINVKPLPVEGRPDGFLGTNVGSWTISSSLDSYSTSTGEPVTFSISVTGDGNVHAIEPPMLPEMEGMRIFEPSRSQDTRRRAGQFGGTKTVSWVLVPNRTGTFSIPAMDFHYFNPSTSEYNTISIDKKTLAVTAGRPVHVAGRNMPAPGSANVLESPSFRTIRYGISPSAIGPPAYRSPVFLGIISITTLIFAGLLLIDTSRRHLKKISADGKGKRAPAIAGSRLRKAWKMHGKGEWRQALGESLGAVQDYIQVSSGICVKGYSRDALRVELERRGCPGDLAKPLCDLIEQIESLLYSPVEPEDNEVSGVLDEAKNLMQKLFSVCLLPEEK